MIWLTLISIVASMAVIWTNVQPVWIQLIVFAISAALFLTTLTREIPKPEKLQKWFQRKSFLILSLFILSAINIVAKKYDHVFDLSKSKIYALRPETLEWIKKIEDPTEILIFLRRDDKTVAYAEWLQEQINQTSDKVKIVIKNINQEVSLSQKYDVKQTGEVVLVSGTQWVKIPSFQEKDLIQGVSRLVSKTSSSICFLTGHGEADLEDDTGEGLGTLKNFLSGTGYRLMSISLTTHSLEQIQKQCGLLTIINPKVNFLPQEIDTFKQLMTSPLPILITLENTFSTNIREELQNVGLTISSDPLINVKNLSLRKPLTDLLITQLNTNPLFENLSAGLYLPQSRALFIHEEKNPLAWSPFLTTPSTAEEIQLLEQKNEKPPFVLGVLSKNDKVVMGTGRSFLTSSIGYAENQKLFFNLAKMLLKEPMVNLSKSFEESEKQLILSSTEVFWVKNFCFYILPIFFTAICFLVWIKRWKIS